MSHNQSVTVTIPSSRRPDNGMTQIAGTWYAMYRANGKIRKVSLGTSDVERAREERDSFYDALIERGAVRAIRAGRPVKLGDTGHGKHYIYKRKPWFVRLPDGRYADFETEEEARAWRNIQTML